MNRRGVVSIGVATAIISVMFVTNACISNYSSATTKNDFVLLYPNRFEDTANTIAVGLM